MKQNRRNLFFNDSTGWFQQRPVLSYQFASILVTPLNHTMPENRKKKQEKTGVEILFSLDGLHLLPNSQFSLLKQVTIIELCTSVKIETGIEMIKLTV